MCQPLHPHIVYQCNSHWIGPQVFKFPILPHCVCPHTTSAPRQDVSVFVHCSIPFSGDVHCETQPWACCASGDSMSRMTARSWFTHTNTHRHTHTHTPGTDTHTHTHTHTHIQLLLGSVVLCTQCQLKTHDTELRAHQQVRRPESHGHWVHLTLECLTQEFMACENKAIYQLLEYIWWIAPNSKMFQSQRGLLQLQRGTNSVLFCFATEGVSRTNTGLYLLNT